MFSEPICKFHNGKEIPNIKYGNFHILILANNFNIIPVLALYNGNDGFWYLRESISELIGKELYKISPDKVLVWWSDSETIWLKRSNANSEVFTEAFSEHLDKLFEESLRK